MTTFWKNKKVVVTGGAGFLGSFVIAKLKERGATDIYIPLIEDYDLTDSNDISRLFDTTLEGIDAENIHVVTPEELIWRIRKKK